MSGAMCSQSILQTMHEECFFHKRPEPLMELLYELGVFGRTAEVFWVYHQFAYQSGDWSCQVAASFLAAKLRTDIRTIQRANDKLVSLGLIERVRSGSFGPSGKNEAPAITKIVLPKSANELLALAIKRRKLNEFEATETETTTTTPTDKPSSEHEVALPPLPSPTVQPTPRERSASPAQVHTDGTQKTSKQLVQSDVERSLNALPESLQTAYQFSVLKGSRGAFVAALKAASRESFRQSDVDVLMRVLRGTERARKQAVVETRSKDAVRGGTLQAVSELPAVQAQVRRPDEPRRVPAKILEFLTQRVLEHRRSVGKSLDGSAAIEALYAITVGTWRGLDLMLSVNSCLKLIRNGRWMRPRGMPAGWDITNALV